ncbi:hypothetical protein HII36_09610 [Nonomuraea sp. NN258]|uniref:hypothetical protein n=1 Tax=Nonomuraea antri TaxID=2730852 RepID=UPI00156A0823|nr:hypothetical protein [Nonomuraea antri]NRQ32092.1 hypothetical protein [Nonomuraea antri]
MALVVVAVCGCQGQKEALPPITATPAASVPSVAVSSPRTTHERVQQTYIEYWKVLAQAGKEDPDQARALLKAYVMGAYLDHLVDGVRKMRDKGQEPAGQVSPHVKEVWIAGGDAKVVDCQGVSGAHLVTTRSGQVVSSAKSGKAFANIEATLQRGKDGRWRLASLHIKDESCTPPS